MAVRAFPDTNVLLEFKSIREIPWRKLLATDEEILIMIAQQVTTELNGHRRGPKPRLQKRARRVTQELERYENAGTVPDQEDVEVVFGLRPPSSVLFQEHDLDPSEGDDRIMALMLQERKSHPKDRFVLVSADINHRQRSRGYGLEAIGVPEEYALEPEPDPRDEMIKAKDQRIRDLEDVLPILEVNFHDGTNILRVPRPRFLDAGVRAQEYVREMETAQAVQQSKYPPNGGWAAQIGEYRRAFPDWARKQAEVEALKARTVGLPFKVTNKGNGNAYSSIVDLTLPENFERFNVPFMSPSLVNVPRPHSTYDPGRDYYTLDTVPLLVKAEHVSIGPERGRSGIEPRLHGRTARFEFGNLTVGTEAFLGTVVFAFEEATCPAQAFEIPYRILADKMPPSSGKLVVKWDDAA